MTGSVTITGLDQLDNLAATFTRKLAVIDAQTTREVRKTAFDAERYAKNFAAVDTGFMKNSIHTEEQVNQPREYSMRVVAGADYSWFVEHGTSRMAPQPFMRPAAEHVRPGFEEAMRRIANPLDTG